MHEYEAVSLFLEYVNTSIQLILAYVSILSAFLVMSYCAAPRLHRYLQSLKESGALQFDWFGTNPFWAVILLTYLHHIVTFGGYLAAMAFFIYQRKRESGAL